MAGNISWFPWICAAAVDPILRTLSRSNLIGRPQRLRATLYRNGQCVYTMHEITPLSSIRLPGDPSRGRSDSFTLVSVCTLRLAGAPSALHRQCCSIRYCPIAVFDYTRPHPGYHYPSSSLSATLVCNFHSPARRASIEPMAFAAECFRIGARSAELHFVRFMG